MTRLTGTSGPVLFALSLLVSGAIAGLLHVSLHRWVRPSAGESAGSTAAAYMTALGSLFAILTAFLISSEYATLRDAQNLVADESAAASRLAFATAGLPAADVSLVQDRLASYLRALEGDEWRALAQKEPQRSTAFAALNDLQTTVFNVASRSYAPASSRDGMATAVADLTSLRSQRIAIGSTPLPGPLLALSMLAGLALVANAIVVTLRSSPWTTVVAMGIVVIVALNIALIIGISAPFRGPFLAGRAPIADLGRDIRGGRYLPWVPTDTTTAPSQDACRTDRHGCVVLGIGEPFHVGALLWVSSGGLDSQRGVDLAIDYLDGTFDGVSGTLLGHDVQTTVVDDRCSADGGRQGAEFLAEDRSLIGIIGTTCSASAAGAADRVASEAGVVLVSPSNTAPELTDPERHQRFYARTAPNDRIQGAVVASFVAQQLGSTRAATISDGTLYADSLAREFSARYSLLGNDVVAAFSTAADADLGHLTSELAALRPDVIYFPVNSPLCRRLGIALRSDPRLGASRLMTSDGCLTSEVLAALGPAAAGLFASGPDMRSRGTDSFYRDEFLAAYSKRFGTAPIAHHHANAFDAANLLFDAVRRTAIIGPGTAVTIPRTALRNALLTVDGYVGVSGTLQCTPTGDCAQAAQIGVFRAPAWPVQGGSADPQPVFSQYLTLREVGTSG